MRSFHVLLVLMILIGCASQEKEKIEQEASKSQVTTAHALGNRIEELIDGSTQLSPAQKEKLQKIIAVNKQTAMDLAQESYQYRSVLIKELLEGSADQFQIDALKSKIREIELAKLKNTFDTAEIISLTVSDTPENRKLAEKILLLEKGLLTHSKEL